MTKSTTSIIIVVIIVAIVLYLWSQSGNETFNVTERQKVVNVVDNTNCGGENRENNKILFSNPNTGNMNNVSNLNSNRRNRNEREQVNVVSTDNDIEVEDDNSEMEIEEDGIMYDQSTEDSDHHIKKKFMTRDRARDGKYKHDSYTAGKRGGTHDVAIDFIDQSNDLMQAGIGAGDQFVDNDETKAKYAPYKPEKNHTDKFKVSEIFNRDNYLPNEQSLNSEWWDMVPEPTSVKNRHLINTTKAMPITSIGGSLRNAGYDIRGSPPCPKFIVSPWMQSTIEPDTNLKSLCV